MLIYLKFPSSSYTDYRQLSIDADNEANVNQIQQSVSEQLDLDSTEYTLVSTTGLALNSTSLIRTNDVLLLCPRVLGGKGGFGSLLRSFGKQITKSTNKDACRDLTGRRMKHVNQEKRLKEFMAHQAEQAKEKEIKKKEKSEKRKRKLEQLESGPATHVFLDPKYDEGREKINQDLEEALSKAAERDLLKRKKQNEAKTSQPVDEPAQTSNGASSESGSSSDNKKPADSDKKSVSTASKFKDWLGVDDLDVSSSSDEEDQAATKSKP